MEGNIYECKWKRAKGKFRLCLKSDDQVYAEDSDFEEAHDELCDRICGVYGDGEAVLQFDRLLPSSSQHPKKSWVHPDILDLGYNESVQTNAKEQGMYLGERCDRCGGFPGGRSNKILEIRSTFPGVFASESDVSASLLIVSDAFTDLLTADERALLGLRPTESLTSSKNQYFELTGPPVAAFVSFQGANYQPFLNWSCPL